MSAENVLVPAGEGWLVYVAYPGVRSTDGEPRIDSFQVHAFEVPTDGQGWVPRGPLIDQIDLDELDEDRWVLVDSKNLTAEMAHASLNERFTS